MPIRRLVHKVFLLQLIMLNSVYSKSANSRANAAVLLGAHALEVAVVMKYNAQYDVCMLGSCRICCRGKLQTE